MAVGRRAVLGALAVGALGGCGRGRGAEPPDDGPPAAPPAPVAPVAVPAALPDRAAVVARYAGIRPESWGTDVAGVVTARPGPALALTFDACGGPGGDGYDGALIDTLRTHRVPATLFLNARWTDANPERARELAADPLFEIGNHGTAHRPLSVTGRAAYGIAGTHDAGEAYDEVAGNHARLTALLGRPPRWFRSGTAHYDEVATRIVADLGEQVAGFAVNADGGATFTAEQVRTALADVPPGALVIAHLNHPAGGTAPGFAAAIPALLATGHTFARLSD
ncbi:polysaccharide deacetylase family protein [Kitasatospora sp. NPDC048365]|uniref:polysaccharide deacetylase family protein n=1 Tax=Kitasatospora sp. NPDC048365 TaxID=3364050 RepID=UPI00371CC92B